LRSRAHSTVSLSRRPDLRTSLRPSWRRSSGATGRSIGADGESDMRRRGMWSAAPSHAGCALPATGAATSRKPQPRHSDSGPNIGRGQLLVGSPVACWRSVNAALHTHPTRITLGVRSSSLILRLVCCCCLRRCWSSRVGWSMFGWARRPGCGGGWCGCPVGCVVKEVLEEL